MAAVEHEVLEQGELFRGESDIAAAAPDGVVDAVELNFTAAEDLIGDLGTAAEEGAAAGCELEETKGLQQAIVGPHIEALDAGVKVIEACEHEEGRLGALRFQFGKDLEAVAVTEAEVKNDEVRLLFGDVADGLISMFEPLGGVAFVFNLFREECSEVAITFDDEYMHDCSSPCSKACRSLQGAGEGTRGLPVTCFEAVLWIQDPPCSGLSAGN